MRCRSSTARLIPSCAFARLLAPSHAFSHLLPPSHACSHTFSQVLGGLDGDDIVLDTVRVAKLATRLRGWIHLRATPPSKRRVALLLYGFPPNVGATGDVPATLDALLHRLRAEGYDLGDHGSHARGETLIAALATITQEPATACGAGRLSEVLDAAARSDGRTAARVDASSNGLGGAEVVASAVQGAELKKWLGEELSARLEAQWGALREYRGLATQPDGGLVCAGLQLGNVFVGVQPLLGIEGDPMRLMFERDLTPHPQYSAFYEWLWQPRRAPASDHADEAAHAAEGPASGIGADAVIHVGMHGTVEWLPGSPLGGTATTWPDKLLGGAPNIYLCASTRPSHPARRVAAHTHLLRLRLHTQLIGNVCAPLSLPPAQTPPTIPPSPSSPSVAATAPSSATMSHRMHAQASTPSSHAHSSSWRRSSLAHSS